MLVANTIILPNVLIVDTNIIPYLQIQAALKMLSDVLESGEGYVLNTWLHILLGVQVLQKGYELPSW